MADKQVVEIEQSSGAKSGEWVVIDCVAFFWKREKAVKVIARKTSLA